METPMGNMETSKGNGGVCPNCGYCPCCGRRFGNFPTPCPYPYPINPAPYVPFVPFTPPYSTGGTATQSPSNGSLNLNGQSQGEQS